MRRIYRKHPLHGVPQRKGGSPRESEPPGWSTSQYHRKSQAFTVLSPEGTGARAGCCTMLTLEEDEGDLVFHQPQPEVLDSSACQRCERWDRRPLDTSSQSGVRKAVSRCLTMRPSPRHIVRQHGLLSCLVVVSSVACLLPLWKRTVSRNVVP